MKVALTGATGFVGQNLWPSLQKAGYEVRLLARDPSKIRGSGLPPVLKADVTDASTLTPAVMGMDAVIHCAALMSDREWAPWSQFLAHNVQGTKNLLAACVAQGVRRFIHISTVIVEGVRGSRYAASKALAEEAVRASKIPWTILRLPAMYGPKMIYGWPEAARQLKAGRFRLVGDGRGKLQLTHVQDAVDGIVLALKKSEAVGQTYNLTGPSVLPLRDVFGVMAKALGVPPPSSVPYPLAMAAATLLSIVPAALKPPALRLLAPYRLRYFTEDHVYDNAKARRELDFNPKITVEEGLTRFVRELSL